MTLTSSNLLCINKLGLLGQAGLVKGQLQRRLNSPYKPKNESAIVAAVADFLYIIILFLLQ